MAPEPPTPTTICGACSSSHNAEEHSHHSLQRIEEMNADVHPHLGPVAPSVQDDVRPPPPVGRHPRSVPAFNQVLQGTSRPFQPRPRGALHPILCVLHLLVRPVAWSVNTPLPDMEFSPPANPSSLSSSPNTSLYPTPPHPHVYILSTTPQVYVLTYISSAPPTPGVHLHTFTPHSSFPTSNTACVSHPPSSTHTSRRPILPRPPLAHHYPFWGFVRVSSPDYPTFSLTAAGRLGMPAPQFRTSCSPSTTTFAWL